MRQENLTQPCTPWYYPFIDANSTYCDPWQAKKFDEMVTSEEKERRCDHCLPDCQTTMYMPSVTTTPFR